MRLAILPFPPDSDLKQPMLWQAIQQASMEPIACSWDMDHDYLSAMDGYIIIGSSVSYGTSYFTLRQQLNRLSSLLQMQSCQGKPILGIAGGAVALVEMGLVPGLLDQAVGLALVTRKHFAAASEAGLPTVSPVQWMTIQLTEDYQRGVFTRYLHRTNVLSVPVTTPLPCFIIPPALWLEMEWQGLTVFQYSPVQPTNPLPAPILTNEMTADSLLKMKRVAGISNKAANVLAIVPYLEQAVDGAGQVIFKAMHDYLLERQATFLPVMPLFYHPRLPRLPTYSPMKLTNDQGGVTQMVTISQRLTEEAEQVQACLSTQAGIPLSIYCYHHWEIWGEISGKEQPVLQVVLSLAEWIAEISRGEEVGQPLLTWPWQAQQTDRIKLYLIRQKNGLIGTAQSEQRPLMLQGRLWCFDISKLPAEIEATDWLRQLLSSQQLFNCYEHDCYCYPANSLPLSLLF